MKRKLTVILCASALTALLLSGCGTKKNETTAAAETTVAAETTIEETETATEETATEAATEASKTAALEDGTYEAEFNTDSSMFHANEACDGKGTLTVENGVYDASCIAGFQEHCQSVPRNGRRCPEGGCRAAAADPTDTVTYKGGSTEEVYGFDIPVPALDEEFDLALIGTKGKWYDHKVSVSTVKAEE